MLSQDNIMRFINIETCKLLFDIGSPEEGISTAVISPNGQYIASVMKNGSLNLYSVQALTQEGNKVEYFTFLKTVGSPLKDDLCLHKQTAYAVVCRGVVFNNTKKEKVICTVSFLVPPACQVTWCF